MMLTNQSPSNNTLTRRSLASVVLFLVLLFLGPAQPSASAADSADSAAAASSNTSRKKTKSLQEIDNWRVYPVRSQDEAAVIEWGHSAIISALDAAVAHFGPQTAQAALLEVETMPVLAEPVNGVWNKSDDDGGLGGDEKEPNSNNDSAAKGADGSSSADETSSPKKVRLLDNADQVHGNVVVMTDTGGVEGLDLALTAQASGAAALIVVHVDDDRPDDIYRLRVPPGREEEAASIDLPVVVISLASANVLTTATVTADMQQEDIVNSGMPDRIRLYAGGDRPFFEDVEAAEPTVYVIHNLLTVPECDALVKQAENKVQPVTVKDPLQLTADPSPFVGTERVMLWQGMLKGPAGKAVEERIEQVTGFPSAHYSDWIIDRLQAGSHWKPHYDVLPGNFVPLATITVFLSEPPADSGGEIVYPSTNSDPIKIRPVKGMAVVHHNTNDKHEFEQYSLHALMPVSGTEAFYVARKYILAAPVSNARRIALPVVAAVTGGKLPGFMVQLHDYLTLQFGIETGGTYFDKLVVYGPLLLLLALAQYIGKFVHKQMQGSSPGKAKSAAAPTRKKPNKKKD